MLEIRQARKAIGISQGELARMMGVSQASVCQWENGTTKPDISKLKPLAYALGITLDELLADDERAI